MNKPALVVEYVVTADGFDGEPWPPNAAGPWVVVARARLHQVATHQLRHRYFRRRCAVSQTEQIREMSHAKLAKQELNDTKH
jgi:hypothetical protein